MSKNSTKLLVAIGWAGLLAGSLDIIAACGWFTIQTGRDPSLVLRFIASGALGLDALTGGWSVKLLGLFFHFVIAYSWTTLFFLAYPLLPKWNWIVKGVAYGIVIWMMMNLVVLPLTKIPSRPFNINQALTGTIILILMVGLPVSFLSTRYYSK